MLAFEVFVDDERICLAGMEDWAVMSVILSGSRPRPREPDIKERLEVSVGGLSEANPEGLSHHARWGNIDLRVGSKVTINVVDADKPDEPIKRYRSDHEVQESPFTEEEMEQMELDDWLRLKAKFEPDNRLTK